MLSLRILATTATYSSMLSWTLAGIATMVLAGTWAVISSVERLSRPALELPTDG
jgi:hypothetical protein